MSISYHSSFWHPGSSLDVAISKILEALRLCGFAPTEKGPVTPAGYRQFLKADPSQRLPTADLEPLLHLPTDARVFLRMTEFRVKEGLAVRVHLSVDECEFRKRHTELTPYSSAMMQFEAALVAFYELSGAHYGHIGAGELNVSTYMKGMDYHDGLAIEASKVIRDEIPLLDLINLVPKSMYSKFSRPIGDLTRYDQHLRVVELCNEGLLLAFTECMTRGGGANWWQFAQDFGLQLDTP